MTKIKRLVAVALAFLMILGSLSMAAYAWNVGDDGSTLGIETKFFRNVNGEWVETTKVEQGEEIKARVYLSTDYYTNSGNLLFFYNNSFLKGKFTTEENTLVVNPYYASYPYTITGVFYGEGSASNAESSMVKRNAITQAFADANDFINVVYAFDGTSYNQKFHGDKWFCEFDFTVKADASTADAGNLFVVESTFASPSFTRGIVDVPQGEYNKRNASTVSMTNWKVTLASEENPVTLFTNKVAVTFNANGGLFDDSTETAYYEGDAGETLSPEAPSRSKYTFKGWAVKGTEEIVDATVYPAGDTEYVAIWESNTVSDGEAVDFETRFYRLDEETGEWIYTEKAQRGEALKARIFINTNYFTNAGDVIVFYNNQFFTDTYTANQKQTLAVNTEAGSAVANGIYGEFVKYNSNDNEIQKLVDNGYITASFAEQHNAYAINYIFNPATGKKLTVNDWSSASEEWLFEFDVQVSATASGMEYFWIEEKTIMNPDEGIYAFINVPVSTEGGDNTKVIALHSINVNKTIDNGFVELDTTLTFNANEGVFAENNSDEIVINGFIGDVVVAPKDPTKEGFTFMGWADEEGNPVEVPSTMPYDDATLTAIWQKQVDISYDTDGDGEVDVTETVTSGQEFVKPADPTKEGHKFIGWGENDNTGATITGIPDVYPGEDTTYTAIFDTLSYEVNYYVRDPKTLEFKLVAEVPIPFGELIAHRPSTAYKTPEGYSLSEAYSNASLTTLLADDATMPASAVDVYFKLVPVTVTVTFDALEGAWADGETKKNVEVVYDTQIVAPEDPTREGYNFIGWTPDVEIMEDIEENYFFAIWEEATYYATFKVDDAVHAKFDHFMGEVIDTPDEPYKEGYTFIGWNNFTEGVTTMPAEDVEFIAVFEVNKYDATFDAGEGFFGTLDAPETDDEGNVVTEKTEEVAFGSDINDVLPADPVREGYTFGGWDPVPGTMPNEDTTYTAIWNANANTPYTVEYYTMDTKGEGYALTGTQTMSGTTDAVINVPANAPTGFAINAEKSTYDDGLTIGADGKTVVTVYFDRNAYTITFDGNDGTVNGEASIANTYYYGAAVAVPATDREGYTFTGWKDADGKDVTVNLTATADATYVAQWSVNQYTVNFDTDGGSEIAPITGDFGETIEVPADPKKEGYTFDGWVDAEGKPADVPTTMPAEDTDLKATWKINNYDISIDANGGKLADGNETFTKADVDYATDLVTLGVPMAEPTREGYTFLGWSENKDATEAENAEIPATMPADDIIWYAVWEINEHSITFDTDGGSEIAPITGDYGEAIDTPKDPTKEGHTFAGWVDEEGKPADVPTTMPDEDVVLKATWTVNSYKVVYKTDETAEAEVTTYDVEFGASIPVPAVPTKTGYTFGGWYEAESGKANTDYATMPAENLEFIAKWNNIQGVEYYFDVYKMGVDGKYPATPDRSTLIGEANSPATVKYTAPAGFKLESYKLSDTISADINNPTILYAYVAREEYKFTAYLEKGSTETVAEGTYLYEAPVASVADPEKDGYVFDGWVDAEGNAADIPPSMPAGEVTVYATWVKDAFDATFDAGEGATFPGGSQTVTDPTEFDAPIEAPADDPVKDGYDFVGWAPADDPENVITDGDFGKMDADGEEFVAVWEKATYKVTFYDYVPADGGTITPSVTKKIVSADYEYEEKIFFPSEVDLYGYEHYIFMGWTVAENMPPVITDEYTEEMLAKLLVDTATETADFANVNENGEINYYAVYKRVKVMLIPKNDECTTVIDRNGGTVDDYKNAVAAGETWYVYGLQEILKDTVLLAEYIDVQGDGRIEIVYRDREEGRTHEPWTGTGTVINVYDNVTDELVESFYIVIYGDLNGDSYITAGDVSLAEDESLGLTYWSMEGEEEYAPYMVKAADLSGNNWVISATDVAIIESASLGLYEVFQEDGTYEDYI